MYKLLSYLLATLLLIPVQALARPVPAAPAVDAKSYILLDFQSGKVLAEHNANQRLAPASITKLMTAYVVFKALSEGKIALDDPVYVSEKAWRMKGSRMFIEVDDRVVVDALLKGMIVQSGNDASVALAEHVAGNEEVFATVMNAEAEALGMIDSHFINATGLPDENHYMSARDIAVLASAIIRNFPDQYPRYSQREFTYNEITQHNRNKLLWRDDSVDGLKTGYTKSAGYCLVSSAMRGDMRLISVVMGTRGPKARATFSEALLNYGFRFYETHRLFAGHEALAEPRIWKGAVEHVPVGVENDLYVTIPRGDYDALDARMEFDQDLVAPISSGQQFGQVIVALNGTDLERAPLVALESIPQGGLWRQAKDTVIKWWQE